MGIEEESEGKRGFETVTIEDKLIKLLLTFVAVVVIICGIIMLIKAPIASIPFSIFLTCFGIFMLCWIWIIKHGPYEGYGL